MVHCCPTLHHDSTIQRKVHHLLQRYVASSSRGCKHLQPAIKEAEAALFCPMYLGNQLWLAIVLSDLADDNMLDIAANAWLQMLSDSVLREATAVANSSQ